MVLVGSYVCEVSGAKKNLNMLPLCVSEVKASSFLTLGQASGFNCEVIQFGCPLFATKGFVYKSHQDCISYLIMDVPTLRTFFSPIQLK